MGHFKKLVIRISLALIFLMGGLVSGGIMSANASEDCTRSACNDNNECIWVSADVNCIADDSDCNDGPCSDPGTK